MVNDLHSNSTTLRLVEWAAGVAVEGFPGFGVDLGFEGGLEGFVGIACT